MGNKAPIKVRSVWISDVHLGFRICHDEACYIFCIQLKLIICFLLVTLSTSGVLKRMFTGRNIIPMSFGLYWVKQSMAPK